MHTITDMTKEYTVTEAKAHLNEIVERLQLTNEDVVVTRHGRNAALLTSWAAWQQWLELAEVLCRPGVLDRMRANRGEVLLEDLVDELRRLRLRQPLADLVDAAPAAVGRVSGIAVGTEYLTLTEAKAHLNELIERADVTDLEVIITRRGKPAAHLLSRGSWEGWLETVDILSTPGELEAIRVAEACIDAGEYSSTESIRRDLMHRTE